MMLHQVSFGYDNAFYPFSRGFQRSLAFPWTSCPSASEWGHHSMAAISVLRETFAVTFAGFRSTFILKMKKYGLALCSLDFLSSFRNSVYKMPCMRSQGGPRDAAVNFDRYSAWIYFRSIPTCVITVPERHRETDVQTDGQTDNILWHNRALRSIAR